MSRRTVTKSFGVGKRENHDASGFYLRKLCRMPLDSGTHGTVNSVPRECVDQIFVHSSETMPEVPDSSVSLMVTSPPYNVGKDYDADLSLKEYLDFLKRVLSETFRVLLPGGRAAINVANLGRKPYIPLNSYLCTLAESIGFLMRGEIIWVKGKGASGSCAWGSWMSASNPTLRDLHEYILIFSKGRFDRPEKGRSTISRDEFIAATTSVWHIPPESARRVGHPAPFPVALVERLIRLYTFEGDVILDPFMGSGTSAVAARKTGRHFIGYEINEEYADMALRRVQAARSHSRAQACGNELLTAVQR
ncbi:MAG: DNA-methyltransferase [Desulfomonilaceae bacterium]